ncbi:MAG: prepilin-type N-terminal cleavage/methylation domain-containing protein [Desulfobacteraceae bacterium]|nr:prepilin-type N-terminal cleavage/methylation domain-containing protein [Desulfobacteraceae bacterium]MCF8094214.1 prepilin-type N-terminal cleavage/methylation domain-containing protein [Desulfobacteraceae bacterium]
MRNFDTRPVNKSDPKGFTLMEVLVALSIIAIALISVIRLQGQTIGMCEAVKFYSSAPFLAQAKISDAVMDFDSYTGGASGDFEPQYPDLSWKVDIIEKQIGPAEYPEVFVAEIKAKIIQKDGRGMTYTVSTYRPQAGEGL